MIYFLDGMRCSVYVVLIYLFPMAKDAAYFYVFISHLQFFWELLLHFTCPFNFWIIFVCVVNFLNIFPDDPAVSLLALCLENTSACDRDQYTVLYTIVMLGCLVLRGKFRVPEKSSPGGDISETSASVAVETPGYWRWQESTKGDGLCRLKLAWGYKTNCVWDGSTGDLCLPSLWGSEAMS